MAKFHRIQVLAAIGVGIAASVIVAAVWTFRRPAMGVVVASHVTAAELLERHAGPLDFKAVTFQQGLDQLSARTRVTIHADWPRIAATGVEADRLLGMELEDMPLGKALAMTLGRVSEQGSYLACWEKCGVVYVGSHASPPPLVDDVVTVAYDVHDIVTPVRGQLAIDPLEPPFVEDQSGGASLFGGGPYRRVPPAPYETGQEQIDVLIRMLMDSVAPNSWLETGGTIGRLQDVDHLLIVTQRPEEQRKVANLISHLRGVRLANTRSLPPVPRGVDILREPSAIH